MPNAPDPATDPQRIIEALLRRFRGATLQMLEQVLMPLQIPLAEIDKTIQRHGFGYGAGFVINTGTEEPVITRGRSGKIVPREFLEGAVWKELSKARIHDAKEGRASGELHGGNKTELEARLSEVDIGDILEIDRYGITAKLESALTEAALAQHGLDRGYKVTRMPEDIARHLGSYANVDFIFVKTGIQKKVESKSLWGTNTKYARLIHSLGPDYATSSCKFASQDIFAVNLWLRTGCITEIAFARSVPKDDDHPYGLPCATKRGSEEKLSDYVHQNPTCEIGNGVWFSTIDEVWELP